MTLSLSAGPADLGVVDTPLLFVALPTGATVDAALAPLDGVLGGALSRTLERRDFRGTRDETLHLTGTATGPRRVLLLGLGRPTERAGALRRAGAIAARQGGRMGVGALAIHAGPLDARETEALAVGLAAGAWDYTDTKTPPPADERREPLASARILGANAAELYGTDLAAVSPPADLPVVELAPALLAAIDRSRT
jgi:leucyl aminopeptidase